VARPLLVLAAEMPCGELVLYISEREEAEAVQAAHRASRIAVSGLHGSCTKPEKQKGLHAYAM
jgi:hypothetical protein